MIHTLHGYRAGAIEKPELQPVLPADLTGAPDDPAALFCHAVSPGEDGTGAPSLECCPQFGKEEPVMFQPGGEPPFEPVGKIGCCRLPLVQPPEEPLGPETIPEAGDLLFCPR